MAGIAGFVSGLVLESLFPVFEILSPPWYFWFILIIIVTADFLSGLSEALEGGFLFGVGLIFSGFVLNDLSTIVLGISAIIGFVVGIRIKNR